jgi:hypothetical protein
MALTKISGNQINVETQATIDTLNFNDANSTFTLPTGTTSSPVVGMLRFNATIDNAQIYVADDGTGSAGWTSVAGGGPSLGEDSVVRTNNDEVDEDITIGPNSPNSDDKFTNGFSAGPITITNGNTVTVQTGASWSII